MKSEADLLGLQYLYKTGYDPLGMVEIFEKIFSFDDRKHSKLANLTSTHPGDRRPAGQRAEKYRGAAEGAASIHRDNVGIRQHEGAAHWHLIGSRKPEPAGPKPPTLRSPGDQLGSTKKTVLETDARASQIKEAYTKW